MAALLILHPALKPESHRYRQTWAQRLLRTLKAKGRQIKRTWVNHPDNP